MIVTRAGVCTHSAVGTSSRCLGSDTHMTTEDGAGCLLESEGVEWREESSERLGKLVVYPSLPFPVSGTLSS